MGIRSLNDSDAGAACMYDSVSGFAFGPLFYDDTHPDLLADEAVSAFVAWCDYKDPRVMADAELEDAIIAWLAWTALDSRTEAEQVGS